ncbi:MAG: hypothetical protein P4M13_04030 [Alphaproteobacteria bacterium]|nr:hypothetical protein [Alphaproteobacteria bacterium]
MSELEEYRQKVAGLNIDQRSLLSTDYFNTFNSVVMVMEMLPDAPDMLEEVEQWRFNDYVEHFKSSGLDFADIAIEAYAHSPPELREAFERKINGMRVFLEEAAHMLRRLYDAGETQTFSHVAQMVASLFRGMMEEGNAIVHGGSASTQADIDKMF